MSGYKYGSRTRRSNGMSQNEYVARSRNISRANTLVTPVRQAYKPTKTHPTYDPKTDSYYTNTIYKLPCKLFFTPVCFQPDYIPQGVPINARWPCTLSERINMIIANPYNTSIPRVCPRIAGSIPFINGAHMCSVKTQNLINEYIRDKSYDDVWNVLELYDIMKISQIAAKDKYERQHQTFHERVNELNITGNSEDISCVTINEENPFDAQYWYKLGYAFKPITTEDTVGIDLFELLIALRIEDISSFRAHDRDKLVDDVISNELTLRGINTEKMEPKQVQHFDIIRDGLKKLFIRGFQEQLTETQYSHILKQTVRVTPVKHQSEDPAITTFDHYGFVTTCPQHAPRTISPSEEDLQRITDEIHSWDTNDDVLHMWWRLTRNPLIFKSKVPTFLSAVIEQHNIKSLLDPIDISSLMNPRMITIMTKRYSLAANAVRLCFESIGFEYADGFSMIYSKDVAMSITDESLSNWAFMFVIYSILMSRAKLYISRNNDYTSDCSKSLFESEREIYTLIERFCDCNSLRWDFNATSYSSNMNSKRMGLTLNMDITKTRSNDITEFNKLTNNAADPNNQKRIHRLGLYPLTHAILPILNVVRHWECNKLTTITDDNIIPQILAEFDINTLTTAERESISRIAMDDFNTIDLSFTDSDQRAHDVHIFNITTQVHVHAMLIYMGFIHIDNVFAYVESLITSAKSLDVKLLIYTAFVYYANYINGPTYRKSIMTSLSVIRKLFTSIKHTCAIEAAETS